MTLATRLRAACRATGPAYSGDWAVSSMVPDPARVLTDAAVLIGVVDRSVPTLILTRRSQHLRHHPGQIAFPGGRIDSGDADAVAAALREAQEEIALPPAQVEVIGTTDVFETVTNYSITPVLGIVAADLPLVASPGEVQGVFEVEFDHVVDPANHQERIAEFQGRERRLYVIESGGYEIWGATAAMIVNLSRRLA